MNRRTQQSTAAYEHLEQKASRIALQLAAGDNGATATVIVSNPELAAAVIRNALANRTGLPVMSTLEAAGVDLAAFPIRAPLLKASKLPTIIPALDEAPDVTAATLLAAVRRHQQIIHDLVNDIGTRFPHEVLVAYGLAIQLAFPTATQRESSDLDLFAPDTRRAADLVRCLETTHGFTLRKSIDVPTPNGDSLVRKLIADQGGHRLTVDLFSGGHPSSGHSWIAPFLCPDLFDDAHPVPEPGPEVLVASPEYMLVMLAEKTLRKGEFASRRALDSARIVDSAPAVDWTRVVELTNRHHVSAAMAWLLSRGQLQREVPAWVAGELTLPALERRLVDLIVTSSNQRRRQRARAAHRWVSVAR